MGNKFGRYLATVLAVLLPVLTYARDRVRAEVLINEKEAVPAGIRVDRPVQGFAVHGRYAFSFHDGGQHMKAKRVRSFRLPDIEEGDVSFTENDVIQSWTVDAVIIAQGNHISRGVMYLPDGPVPQDMDSGLAGRRALHAFDLASGNTESWMLESFSHEPEDISIFRKRVYLQDYGGKEKGGTVYRVHFLK